MGFSFQPSNTCPALCSSFSCSQQNILKSQLKIMGQKALAEHCCHRSEGKIRGREITLRMKQLLWNLQYLVFLKKTLPGTLVNQCPCVFIRCINTIVQISKPYDLTVQLIINCGPKNYKIPSAKAHPVSCTS